MKNKILIIEDRPGDFKKLKGWVECKIGCSVIPENHREMSNAIKRMDINDYIVKIIKKHHNEIKSIICDLYLGKMQYGGSDLIREIRNLTELNLTYWTSMVPIYAITAYPDMDPGDVLRAGADYVIQKSDIEAKDNIGNQKMNDKAEIMRCVIITQMRKFEKNMDCIYPKNLLGGIRKMKEENCACKSAFIMTSFMKEHKEIAMKVKEILSRYNINGIIADAEGGKYNERLWTNLEIHMHGCDFGIAIYADDSLSNSSETRKRDVINPNLSLEVGYMCGLQKTICYLKSENLRRLPTDLLDVLYVEFNENNLESKLVEWLKNKDLK